MDVRTQSPSGQVEAAADVEVPPRSWPRILDAAEQIATAALPGLRVGLRVTGDAAIRRLNREFRGVDRTTDVLSFPLEDHGTGFAGDIALNWDAALRQAQRHGHSPEAEAVALLAHAMLHLAGWEHPDAVAQQRMDERTVELCRSAGYEVMDFGH